MGKIKSKTKSIRRNKFHIVSLGCAKNTVDSDSMAQMLTRAGYEVANDPRQASVLIVNTCGFIGPAKEESLGTLAELAAAKKGSQLLVAAGCLSQRYGDEVVRRVAGVDGILGTRRWMDIVSVVENLCRYRHSKPRFSLPEKVYPDSKEHDVLRASVQGSSAYLKIADGCRRPCAFCAIPLIKGTAQSRPVDAILSEARVLQEMGMREIILIAQDTTDYGYDLGLKNGLAELLKQMTAAAPRVDWLRIMYTYPGYITDELIEVMATHKQVVPYLDIPLQHAHPLILRRMRRPASVNGVRRTLEKMRKAIPDITLRTTFIVGYPGETEEQFRTLLDFVEEIRFDRVGAFKFSFEPGTPGESLGDPIPDEIKEERFKRLMEKQQPISFERNQAFIGHNLNALIEGAGQGISIGRSYRDAPEIDGLVLVEGKIPAGQIVPVHITGAGVYDLSGVTENRKKRSGS